MLRYGELLHKKSDDLSETEVMNNDVSHRQQTRDSGLFSPAQVDFVEKMGLQVESVGWMPRMSGRVFGALLVSDGPLSQSELREVLQASLGAISGATRELLGMRLAQRVALPGTRQVGLELHHDAWRMLEEGGLRAVQDYQTVVAGGLNDIGINDSPSSQNLQRMRAYFAVVEERMVSVLEWLDTVEPAKPTPLTNSIDRS